MTQKSKIQILKIFIFILTAALGLGGVSLSAAAQTKSPDSVSDMPAAPMSAPVTGVGDIGTASHNNRSAIDKYAFTPALLQGMWAYPRCYGAEDVTVYTRRFIFRAVKDDNVLFRQGPILQRGDVFRLGFTGPTDPERTTDLRDRMQEVYDIKLRGTDEFLYYEPPIFVRNDAPDPFADPDHPDVTSYKKCDEFYTLFSHFKPEGRAALFSLDRIDAVCGTVPIKDSPACRQTVFNSFDTDESGYLESGEIVKAYRQITFISASQGCNIKLHYPSGVDNESREFARAVLRAADQSRDFKLSLKEIEAGWSGLSAIEEAQAFMSMIGNLSYLLPFLPDGELLPGCTCLKKAIEFQEAQSQKDDTVKVAPASVPGRNSRDEAL